MFDLNWEYIDGVGYIREHTFTVNSMLSEGYILSGLKMLEKGDQITDIRYVQEYPNLRLARELGHPHLVGSRWKYFTYEQSYYFDIKMRILGNEMGDKDFLGELRISDHKTSPYAFGENTRHWNNFNGKEYSFGISIVFPRFGYEDDSEPLPEGREVHVFEHVYTLHSSTEENIISKLKSALDNYVGKLKNVITVGAGGNRGLINIPYYKDVTNEAPLLSAEKEIFSKGMNPEDKRTEVVQGKPRKVGRSKKSEVQPEPQPVKSFKTFTDFTDYCKGKTFEEVCQEFNIQPTYLYMTKKGRGNSEPFVRIGNSETLYPMREYNGLLMPCYPDKRNSILKLDTGVYVWMNWTNKKPVAAAAVDGYSVEKLLLEPKKRLGRPPKNLKQEITESLLRYLRNDTVA